MPPGATGAPRAKLAAFTTPPAFIAGAGVLPLAQPAAVTRLKASTEPRPVAKSYPISTPYLLAGFVMTQFALPLAQGIAIVPAVTSWKMQAPDGAPLALQST